MERIATIILLVATVATVGYFKMEQLDLEAFNAKTAAAEAVKTAAADSAAAAAELVEAAKIRFTIPHDRDVNTTDITVALDGSESFDAEGDSLSYSWTQTSGDDVYLRYAEDADGNTTNFRASPGEYTFKLTVSDAYGSTTTGETTVSVAEEPNLAPEVIVKVYETSETIE